MAHPAPTKSPLFAGFIWRFQWYFLLLQCINQKSTYYEKNNEYINAYVENWIIGYAEGMAEEKMAIARNMKEEGMPLPTIARLTGLGVDEIEKL